MNIANKAYFTSICPDYLEKFFLEDFFKREGLHLSFSFTMETFYEEDWIQKAFYTSKQIPTVQLGEASDIFCIIESNDALSHEEFTQFYSLLNEQAAPEADFRLYDGITEEENITIHFILFGLRPSQKQYEVLLENPHFTDFEKKLLKKIRLKQLFLKEKRSS